MEKNAPSCHSVPLYPPTFSSRSSFSVLHSSFFILLFFLLCVSVPLCLPLQLLNYDALGCRVHHPQQELPVRFRVRRRLADLHQHRVLTSLQLDLEAMPVETDAVFILLEGEHLHAVDPDGEVIVRGAAKLGLDRLRDCELGV